MTQKQVLDRLKQCICLEIDPDDSNTTKLLFKVSDLVHESKALECTFFVYPYSQDMDNTSFSILPYEEYVRDIDAGRRSTFVKISPFGEKLFGILLGLLIAAVFWRIKPEELYSLQSLVAILGAYTLGKEMWNDIDNFLINMTKKWGFRWRDAQYFYSKEDFGTVQRFWRMARERRNNKPFVLPLFLDFMTHNNAKTAELYFEKATLQRNEIGSKVQFGSISYKPQFESEIKSKGAMTGFKISLRQSVVVGDVTYEIFQALDKKELGAVDKSGNWQPKTILYRKVWNLGRLRWYLTKEILQDFELIEVCS